MIKKESIDKIKDCVQVVDVIGSVGVLVKKKGADYEACCPFHNEKTPSFKIDNSKNFFKCFGCGESGDSIKFLEKYKGFSFVEAIEYLADFYKISLEYDNEKIDTEKKSRETLFFELMAEVKLKYHQELMQTPDALNYLIERGLERATIIEWQLGFAPANWRFISDWVIANQKWDFAVKAGVCKENGQKNHDIFYNRIMVPIHNENGRCVSFGGRIWTKEQKEKDEPKWINGPGSEIYDKSQIVFGLNKSELKLKDEAWLVEGYFDVIMPWQKGIKHCVAGCGTSVTESHAKKILKRTKNIVLAGDRDVAGQKSIEGAIDLFYKNGAHVVEVLEWPEDVKDIDEYLQQYKL